MPAVAQKKTSVYANKSLSGHTPLRYASQNGNLATVIEMMPYAKTEDLAQSACWAAQGGYHTLLAALLNSTDISPNTISRIESRGIGSWSGGDTLISLAAASLEPECVRLLVSSKNLAVFIFPFNDIHEHY